LVIRKRKKWFEIDRDSDKSLSKKKGNYVVLCVRITILLN
jgi:hypothetical protein